MRTQPIYVTDNDLQRLRRLLAARATTGVADARALTELRAELDRAVVVPADAVPPDVLTMGSRFRLKDLDTGHVAEYTLVYPGEADIRRGRVSVLAPIGTALLGYRELDTIEWEVPAGLKRFRIDQILYQPEAAQAPAL